jgi:hypothetical protein
MVTTNNDKTGFSSVGSLKPRPVMGSVRDSWTVRVFGKAVREDEEERDWSRWR